MSTLTTIQSTDLISNSRTDINNNFSTLNTDKIETSVLDTDTALTANSDSKIATQKATKAYIDGATFVTSLIPTGLIMAYGGSSAPTNWLICDGTAVSRSTYSALYAIIGTTYGIGNGSTTFNLPDLRGRTMIGAGTGTKVATFASRSSDTITVTGLTSASNNEFQTGQSVVYHTTGSVITGLSNDGTYYVIRVTNSSFKVASSLQNAQNGTAVTLSGDGTGTQTFTKTLTARTNGDTGGEENHAMSSTELLAHTHTLQTYSNSGAQASAQSISGNDAGSNPSTSSTGGNAAMSVMNPFVAVNYIIKYS